MGRRKSKCKKCKGSYEKFQITKGGKQSRICKPCRKKSIERANYARLHFRREEAIRRADEDRVISVEASIGRLSEEGSEFLDAVQESSSKL